MQIVISNYSFGFLKRFVSELHKVGVMSSNQVVAMAETLLEHGDDRSLEGLCRLLSFSGLPLSRTNEVNCICSLLCRCMRCSSYMAVIFIQIFK